MPTTKTIKTPEALYKLFEAYKDDTKSQPRIVYDFVGRDGNKVAKPLERPLSMAGFEVYAFKNVCHVNQYFDNPDNRYAEYITICRMIRKEIRQDQIEGGMVGQYNASITQRLNALKEHTETTTDLNVKPMFGKNPFVAE